VADRIISNLLAIDDLIRVRKLAAYHSLPNVNLMRLAIVMCALGISLQILSFTPVYANAEFSFQQFQLQQLHNAIVQREAVQQQKMNVLQPQVQNWIQLEQLWWWNAHSNPIQQPALHQYSTVINNNNYNYNNNNRPLQQLLSYPLLSPFSVYPQPQPQDQQSSSSSNSAQCTNGICNTIVTECVNGLCTSGINGVIISGNQECSSDCSVQQMETSRCIDGICTTTFTACINGLCNSTTNRM
jgi:hypothetical protein